jgi:hypothetical protein
MKNTSAKKGGNVRELIFEVKRNTSSSCSVNWFVLLLAIVSIFLFGEGDVPADFELVVAR